jgi:nodulation protein E
MRRVVVTGAGTVNPLGIGLAATWAALAAGRTAIGPLQLRDADRLSVRVGAQVEWDEGRFSRDEAARWDRATQFCMVAAAEAMAQAGAQAGATFDPLRAGAIIGTAAGGHSTIEENYRAVFAEGRNRVPPLTVPRLMASAAPSHLSIAHGLRGPCFAVSSACASSNHAIGLAMQMIRAGAADVMLAGGAEAMVTFGGIKAWEGLRVLSPTTCRPFAAGRDGLVLGEGAAVLLLEEAGHAAARGAPVLAEVAGFEMTADAGDLLSPTVDGPVRAMQGALADAGLAAGEVGYINAHGTGTRLNDATEAQAIRTVFTDPPPVSSTKGAHGHLIGAAGAVEALACLMALDGTLPPTVNHDADDPAIGLDVIPNHGRPASPRACLSNAFAFGGLNAVLAFTR